MYAPSRSRARPPTTTVASPFCAASSILSTISSRALIDDSGPTFADSSSHGPTVRPPILSVRYSSARS
jgi:hypothetical protein